MYAFILQLQGSFHRYCTLLEGSLAATLTLERTLNASASVPCLLFRGAVNPAQLGSPTGKYGSIGAGVQVAVPRESGNLGRSQMIDVDMIMIMILIRVER